MKCVVRFSKGIVVGIWVDIGRRQLKLGGALKAYDTARLLMSDFFEITKWEERTPARGKFSFVAPCTPVEALKVISRMKDDGYTVDEVPSMGRLWA